MAKLRTAWNFKLLYKSDTDPQIEKDMKAIERAFADFEKKYRGKDFTSNAKKLKNVLDDDTKLDVVLNGWKLLRYFHLRKDVESQNARIHALMAKYDARTTEARNKVTFFRLALGKIPAKDQRRFLKDPALSQYRYLLKVIFENSKHDLSEKEEQLLRQLYQPARGMWIEGQEKFLNTLTVPFKGRKLSLGEASNIAHELPLTERRGLATRINEILKESAYYAEGEINAIYTLKKILDEKRGFAKPYSSTVLEYENDEKTVERMVATITRHFPVAHRFYRLHAKILGLKKVTVADRSAKKGQIRKKFDFETSVGILSEVFSAVDPRYAEIFGNFVANGQLDVYPKKGKSSGAYCSGGGDLPTFVLLNHVDSVNSIATIAHEMGHAFHTELSKSQPLHYQGYTFSVAEVASTFFEQVLLERLEKELAPEEYALLLHDKLKNSIATVYRQIALFNFELELHERIRTEGHLAKEEIAKLMAKHFRSYMGDAVEVTDLDGYFFVMLSHMRRFFYVYSYAYGQIISRALFEKWKADKSYAKKIEQFLSAGGSMSPKDIFRSIGIDTTDPKFFETGLKSIEKDIVKLEKLTAKRKR